MVFIILCAAVAFLSGQATNARNNRRDDWVPSNPQALEVNLGFDKVGRYVATIGVVSHEEEGTAANR
jgi:hypothetical protein